MAAYQKMKLLSIGEVSKMLGVSVATLRSWDKKGILAASRYGERKIRRYSEESIEAFIESQKNPRCCFCGKAGKEAGILIASALGTYICEPCVRGCLTILKANVPAPESVPVKKMKSGKAPLQDRENEP